MTRIICTDQGAKVSTTFAIAIFRFSWKLHCNVLKYHWIIYFFDIVFSLESIRGFQIEDIGFLFYAWGFNIGLLGSLPFGLTPHVCILFLHFLWVDILVKNNFYGQIWKKLFFIEYIDSMCGCQAILIKDSELFTAVIVTLSK